MSQTTGARTLPAGVLRAIYVNAKAPRERGEGKHEEGAVLIRDVHTPENTINCRRVTIMGWSELAEEESPILHARGRSDIYLTTSASLLVHCMEGENVNGQGLGRAVGLSVG